MPLHFCSGPNGGFHMGGAFVSGDTVYAFGTKGRCTGRMYRFKLIKALLFICGNHPLCTNKGPRYFLIQS